MAWPPPSSHAPFPSPPLPRPSAGPATRAPAEAPMAAGATSTLSAITPRDAFAYIPRGAAVPCRCAVEMCFLLRGPPSLNPWSHQGLAHRGCPNRSGAKPAGFNYLLPLTSYSGAMARSNTTPCSPCPLPCPALHPPRMPSCSADGSGAKFMPRTGLTTRPVAMICSTLLRTTSAAKQMGIHR
jgi:hypothetical protein